MDKNWPGQDQDQSSYACRSRGYHGNPRSGQISQPYLNRGEDYYNWPPGFSGFPTALHRDVDGTQGTRDLRKCSTIKSAIPKTSYLVTRCQHHYRRAPPGVRRPSPPRQAVGTQENIHCPPYMICQVLAENQQSGLNVQSLPRHLFFFLNYPNPT